MATSTTAISKNPSVSHFNRAFATRQLMTSFPAPATLAVQYSVEQSDSYAMSSSPFIGEPRLELDQAWSSLLQCTLRAPPCMLLPPTAQTDILLAATNIRISESEMRRMNKTSVALRDGSGYLGYLEVHHMLHCLVRVRPRVDDVAGRPLTSSRNDSSSSEILSTIPNSIRKPLIFLTGVSQELDPIMGYHVLIPT